MFVSLNFDSFMGLVGHNSKLMSQKILKNCILKAFEWVRDAFRNFLEIFIEIFQGSPNVYFFEC